MFITRKESASMIGIPEKKYLFAINKFQVEYRVWNPYRSKIAAAILGGVSDIYIRPGVKVLYLGAASGTTVSHVSDIVGQDGKKSSYFTYI